METQRNSGGMAALVVIVLIIIAVVAGFYFWGKANVADEQTLLDTPEKVTAEIDLLRTQTRNDLVGLLNVLAQSGVVTLTTDDEGNVVNIQVNQVVVEGAQ